MLRQAAARGVLLLLFLKGRRRVIMTSIPVEHKQADFSRLKGVGYGKRDQFRSFVDVKCFTSQHIRFINQAAIVNHFAEEKALRDSMRQPPGNWNQYYQCTGNENDLCCV